VVYLTTLSVSQTIQSRIVGWLFDELQKYVEGSGLWDQHFPGEFKKTHRNPSHYSRWPDRDSMRTPAEYKSEALRPALYEIDVELKLCLDANCAFSIFTNSTTLFALLLR
jgi:hypothetical protein